jgi:hypothetical protein
MIANDWAKYLKRSDLRPLLVMTNFIAELDSIKSCVTSRTLSKLMIMLLVNILHQAQLLDILNLDYKR